MFVDDVCYRELEALLLPREAYRPFPMHGERTAWEALPADLRTRLIRKGEERLSFSWPALPVARYMDYFRNGNRSRFEDLYFERRRALAELVLAECVENDGRFLEQIMNGMWCICEESTWVVPSHLNLSRKSNGYHLPDVTDPVIDLFAGETAGLLTWTYYLLGDTLNVVTKMVGIRLQLEMKRRILDPYLEREDFWWMGFSPNSIINNWNPWINSNCVAAFLICESDKSRRLQGVRKALRSLDKFVGSYSSDGGCDEGPGYWSRAGGSLFDCLELLYGASAGRIDFYGQPVVREIGRYIYRAHISGNYFVNFADGTAVLGISAELVARFGKRIEDPRLAAMGRSALRQEDVMSDYSMFRALPALFSYLEPQAELLSPPFVRDVWLDGIHFMTARERDGTDRGLFLAAKGGHNGENHNHNDVGHFIVYADGQPFLIDVGVETYTAQTFSMQRYDIWTMQSGYHNLPVIDGIEQQPGRAFKATDVQYRADDSTAELSMNIAGAYPATAGISSWIRTCRLHRDGEARVEIRDRFQLERPAGRVELHLMTPCSPLMEHGAILLERDPLLRLRICYSPELFSVSTQRIEVSDARLRRSWGDSLYRLVFASHVPATDGDWSIKIERAGFASE